MKEQMAKQHRDEYFEKQETLKQERAAKAEQKARQIYEANMIKQLQIEENAKRL